MDAVIARKREFQLKQKILIVVEGGIVQSICSDRPIKDIEIMVADYDDHAEEPVLYADYTNSVEIDPESVEEVFRMAKE
jgi:hypothetical protein